MYTCNVYRVQCSISCIHVMYTEYSVVYHVYINVYRVQCSISRKQVMYIEYSVVYHVYM